ncbi:type III-B CRISPR module-associated protein Cmr5 [Haliangium ochraceum]|uniref:CRISPR type III-B/RAMP module-associated protein Cmr5 n=1 Tax=Haliangium ochraceum (strain DSM 14365 / JCM 11303 / SMP-2) TaxID=502025 RepID=D0LTH7_HALO1|nr:type III-B CRISPR module-associated protein Cmr5 [Haliangium ochraceum]ACY13872.1 CRISPR-associated protein, Cmr5 family [Haliangium ochraceum DSM 14365]
MSDSPCTIEQQRAADALSRIHELRDQRDCGNYRSYAERLPAQIVTNGLGQALAMLRSRYTEDDQPPRQARDGARRQRGRDHDDPLADREPSNARDEVAYRYLFQHVGGWLCRDHASAPYRGVALNALLMKLSTCDQDTYVRAHAEALAYLNWLKKFARAFLSASKDEP